MATMVRRLKPAPYLTVDTGWEEKLNHRCTVQRRLERGERIYDATVERTDSGLWGWRVFASGVFLGAGTEGTARAAQAVADKVLTLK